ncbi:MAG: LCP family protein [Peptostreptococcaceae bacterium]|nr:LCP family protein [Peptostreptococcaceae bacterium]
MAKWKKLKRWKKVTIIIVAVLLLIIGLGAIYINTVLNKVTINDLPNTNEELGIDEEFMGQNGETVNIALFGVDSRNNDIGRSDTIIILSLDYEENKIKLSSIMRDTYVAVEGYGMTKINHAYAYGGPLLSIKTINQNFELDIRDYVYVDFEGLTDIIDEVGGIDITIKDYEISAMKNYGINTAGEHHLDGTQALGYCRIRYQGNGDFERTDRQREVLEVLFNTLDVSDIGEMTGVLNKVLPYVETSYKKGEIVSLMTSVATSNMKTLEQKRFPVDGFCHDSMIDGVYYLVIDQEENNKQLKEFI